MTVVVVVVLGWLLVGAVLGLYSARRGHWRWLWLLGALAGPFALPLTRQLAENESLARPIAIESGDARWPRASGVRVLVGVDGSDEAVQAARKALAMLRESLAMVTVATVGPFEMHEPASADGRSDTPWTKGHADVVEAAAATLADDVGVQPSTVLLSGRPAEALKAYAVADSYDLIVVGSRGRGLAKRLLGSCASQLVAGSPVPVLVMPTPSGLVPPAGQVDVTSGLDERP